MGSLGHEEMREIAFTKQERYNQSRYLHGSRSEEYSSLAVVNLLV